MADPTVGAETCVALGATEHQFEAFPGHDLPLRAGTGADHPWRQGFKDMGRDVPYWQLVK